MFDRAQHLARIAPLAVLALLSACAIVPKQSQPAPPTTGPSDGLPTDSQRHRVALLVPLAGANGAIGQSIANAATMALLDTNDRSLRLTTYDTSAGAGPAAAKAIADGNRLILGPLVPENVAAVVARARPARVPLISFANDEGVAAADVFVLPSLPSQSVTRTVDHARSLGITRFGALVPRGDYGQRASTALMAATRASGASVSAMEAYDRGNTSVISAARRLRVKGGYQAVLIADGARIATLAAPELKQGAPVVRVLGTELWTGESAVLKAPALKGALFSTVADTRFRQFSTSYRARFGAQPHRVATLGYDAVLLTMRVARDWPVGKPFPAARLLDRSGFLGLDGAFRFGRDGIVERALEVREIKAGTFTVASPAPARFSD